ncbi:MAG: DNA repair protein RecO, partial [Clostridia bacterium]|nr:DNA repair protein RecO [Clostridia bacterium]
MRAALYRAEAVVLKGSEFGEADRLITCLTPDRGLVRAVARGARRPHSRLGGVLLPFAHVDLLCWRGRSLDGISQAELREGFRPLRESLARMARAAFACELAGALVPERQASPAAFRLLLSALRALVESAHPDRVLLAYTLQAVSLAGFQPRLDACAACGRDLPPTAALWWSPG